jgi:hypothetical protein
MLSAPRDAHTHTAVYVPPMLLLRGEPVHAGQRFDWWMQHGQLRHRDAGAILAVDHARRLIRLRRDDDQREFDVPYAEAQQHLYLG